LPYISKNCVVMKGIRFWFLIFTFSWSLVGAGQTTNVFRMNYDVAFVDVPANAIEALSPGNYVFAGINVNFLPIVSSITEINSSGNVSWAKSYSGGLSYQFNDIKKDASTNSYYICGGSSSSSGIFLRLDANGNYLDGNRFDLTNAQGEYLTKIIKTSDGGYVAAGYSYGFDPDAGGPLPRNDSTSAMVVKFDANGNHLWHHVFRFYKNSGKTTPILNDSWFRDVVEVNDGYIFVGSYEVDDVINVNDNGDDLTPDDAMILKTGFNGTITYFKQIDSPSTDGTQPSKYFYTASATSTNQALISGFDGSGAPLLVARLPNSGGWVNPTWIKKFQFTSGLFGVDPIEVSEFFQSSDGNYVAMGTYIVPLASFSQFLFKFDPNTFAQIFNNQYEFDIAVILPQGEQVSDGGYVSLSTVMEGTGFNYHVVKTDPNGAAPTECPANPIPSSAGDVSYTYADPFYNAFTSPFDNSAITPTITSFSPTEYVQCVTLVTACTPPSAPTTVTATPSTICQGESTTITASGPSDPNVTYNVYAAASGGTSLGATPYTVSPGTTTTYYVEAVDNSDPNCVSTTRTPVTVTVTPGPTASNAGSNQDVCGNSATLAGNTPINGTGTWTLVSGSGTITNPSSPTSTITGLGAGANVFEWTITSGSCPPSSSQVTITSFVNPTTSNAGTDQSLCASSATLAGNTPTVGTGVWTLLSGTGTITNPSSPNSTVTGLGNGANVFQWTISNGPCPPSSDQVTITNTGAPTESVAGPDQEVCGNSATLAGNTPVVGTGLWTLVSGTGTITDPSSPTSTVTGLGTGANVFQWTISNGACTPSSSQVTITSVANPTSANAGPDQSLCASSATLAGNTPTVGTGVWTLVSGSGTITTPSSPNSTVTGLGAGSNVFQWTISNGPCPSSSDQVTITNTGAPTESVAGPDQEVCGNSATLAGNTPVVGTGLWTLVSGTGTITDPSSPTSTVTGLGTGANVFQWTISNGACTPSSSQVTITSVANPTSANAGPDQSLCASSATLAGNTPTVGTGVWTLVSGSGTITTPSSPNSTVTGLGAGSNVFQWTISNGPCPSSSDQVTITNTGAPTESVAGPDQEVCGNSATLAGNTPVVGTGLWTLVSGTGTITDPSSPNSTVTGLGTGENVFQWTISNGACTPSSSQVTITSVAPPSAANAGTNQTICGTTINLNGNTPTVGTGTWTLVSGTGTLTNPSSPTSGVTGLGVGPNVFQWTITNGSCPPSSAQVTITNTGGPSAVVDNIQHVSCNGLSDGQATVSASGGSPEYSYQWSPQGGTGATSTLLPAGAYTVVVTDNLGCTADVQVVINQPDAISLTTSSNPSSCATPDGSAEVIATGGSGSYTYSWSPSGGSGSVANNLGAGNYTVTVTDGNGCQQTANVSVVLSDGPVITVTSVNGVTCNGQTNGSASVTVTGGDGNYSYSWSPSGGNGSTANGLAPGAYTITVEDGSGCQVTENILIGEPLAVSVTGVVNNSDCSGNNGSIMAVASGGTGSYAYLWSPNGETSSSITGAPGNYSVVVTDGNGCQVTQSFTIGLTNNLDATILPGNTTIEGGESVQLEVELNPDSPVATYTWTPIDGLSCTDCPNPIASPSVTTTYVVSVLTEEGCSDTAMVTIFVTTPCGDLFMPTIFSPNADGLNDELCVLGGCIVEMDLKIYNRWGEMVFESNSPSICWDGSFRGKPMNSAVFVYKLYVKTSDGQEIEESGNVNLVR
jgi:gliding motility-associated-like protein